MEYVRTGDCLGENNPCPLLLVSQITASDSVKYHPMWEPFPFSHLQDVKETNFYEKKIVGTHEIQYKQVIEEQ